MIRPVLAFTALALTAAAVPTLFFETDFEHLPPTAAELHSALSASGANLAAGVAAAEQATGGEAISAELNPQSGENVIQVLTSSASFEVVVAKDGSITSQTEQGRFPGDLVSGAWTETKSGLKYYDIKVGDGASPPSNTTKVRVHYSGWTLDGRMFDSSYKRNKPADFPLNRVIPGWTEGVGSMKIGGKRKLILPFQLGYGAAGNPAAGIPPRAILVFDVELLEILD